MKPPSERHAEAMIVDLLADLFDSSPKKIRSQSADANRYDYIIAMPGRRFLVEYKASASAGPMASAIDHLHANARQEKGLPLVVVPFMGQVGRELCERSHVSWMDLSGNAKIVAPGLRIHVEGRPNRFSERGRPPNIFAPKSSRVSRQLLLHPKQFQSQAELARETGLDDGYVSKIVRRLQQEQYLDSNDDGAVRPRHPSLLLDAWRDAYAFDRHRIIKGHVPARSGHELLQRVAKHFTKEKLEYAATGLSAAWQFTQFTAFRLVTIYVPSMPSRSVLEKIEFSDEPKGANLWLVLPDDEGVFHGREKQDGIECVSPIQTYLDLQGQPERAKDAALELRRRFLDRAHHGE